MALPRMGRSPDPRLIADLKAILPTVELVNIKDDYWWMLDYQPTGARVSQGMKMKQREYARLKEGKPVRVDAQQVADILAAGYSLIGRYRWSGDAPTAFLVDELRQKVNATVGEMEQAFEDSLDEATGDAAQRRQDEAVREFVRLEGRSIYRHAKRKLSGKGRAHVLVKENLDDGHGGSGTPVVAGAEGTGEGSV